MAAGFFAIIAAMPFAIFSFAFIFFRYFRFHWYAIDAIYFRWCRLIYWWLLLF
jgi:hypothetical protein